MQSSIAESATADASGLSPRVLQFQRGNPWYATDEEVDRLRQEYLTEKYKWSEIYVYELDEFLEMME